MQYVHKSKRPHVATALDWCLGFRVSKVGHGLELVNIGELLQFIHLSKKSKNIGKPWKTNFHAPFQALFLGWGSADFNAPDEALCHQMMDRAILEGGVNLVAGLIADGWRMFNAIESLETWNSVRLWCLCLWYALMTSGRFPCWNPCFGDTLVFWRARWFVSSVTLPPLDWIRIASECPGRYSWTVPHPIRRLETRRFDRRDHWQVGCQRQDEER